jgi:hypothetical protein
MPRLLHRRHLGLHRHQELRRRSLRAALTHRRSSRGGSGKAPIIDLSSSSDEEDLIAATSHDFEFAQRLFGELNRVVLGPPGDNKIIVISDSDEEEAHEKKTTDTKDVAASATVNLTSNASADADDALAGAKNDNSDAQVPIIRLATTMAAEMTPVSLRLPRQEGGKAGVLQGKLQ